MCRDLKHEMFGRDSKGIPEQQTCTDKKKKPRLLHLVVHTTVATHCQLMACHIINTNKKNKKNPGIIGDRRLLLLLLMHHPSVQIRTWQDDTYNEINDVYLKRGYEKQHIFKSLHRQELKQYVQAFPKCTASRPLTWNGPGETTHHIIDTSNQLFIDRLDCARPDLTV